MLSNARRTSLLWILIITCICVTALAVISFTQSRQSMLNLFTNTMIQTSDGLAHSLETWLAEKKNQVLINAQMEPLKKVLADDSSENVEIANQILDVFNDQQDYIHCAVLDSSGKVRASSQGDMRLGADYSDREYFREAISGNMALSNVLVSKTTGRLTVVLAAPIINGDSIIGATFLAFPLTAFSEQFVNPVKISNTGHAFVFGPDGKFLAHPDLNTLENMNLKNLEYGSDILSHKQGSFIGTYNGQSKFVSLSPVPGSNWTVGMVADENDIFSFVPPHGEKMVMISGLASVAALAGLFVWFVTLLAGRVRKQ